MGCGNGFAEFGGGGGGAEDAEADAEEEEDLDSLFFEPDSWDFVVRICRRNNDNGSETRAGEGDWELGLTRVFLRPFMVGEDLEKVSQGEEMGKWKKGGRDRGQDGICWKR